MSHLVFHIVKLYIDGVKLYISFYKLLFFSLKCIFEVYLRIAPVQPFSLQRGILLYAYLKIPPFFC